MIFSVNRHDSVSETSFVINSALYIRFRRIIVFHFYMKFFEGIQIILGRQNVKIALN
jgi:hypothetical protein